MIKKVEPKRCPSCNVLIDEVWETDFNDAMVATNPMEGLTVWGAYGMWKHVICHKDNYVHVLFPNGQSLVRVHKKEQDKGTFQLEEYSRKLIEELKKKGVIFADREEKAIAMLCGR